MVLIFHLVIDASALSNYLSSETSLQHSYIFNVYKIMYVTAMCSLLWHNWHTHFLLQEQIVDHDTELQFHDQSEAECSHRQLFL